MWKMMEWWQPISRDMRRKNISSYAASISFFFFLSMVPLLFMLCTILPHTPITQYHLADAVTHIVPLKAAPFLLSIIDEVYSISGNIMPVAIVITFWSASKGVIALQHGLNAVNDVEEKRNIIIVRVISLLYTAIMLLAIVLSLLINVFGTQLVDLLLYKFPLLHKPISFLMHFRFIVIWLILIIMFAAVFAYIPDKKTHFKDQLYGAVFAAIGWTVYSWLFSMYLNIGNAYGLYGSLAIIVILLLWMYFCMYIMLVGAFINSYRQKVS